MLETIFSLLYCELEQSISLYPNCSSLCIPLVTSKLNVLNGYVCIMGEGPLQA